MLRYKLDNRVLVQIEESFKINRDNANDLLYIRKLDTKGEMYYLEKKLSIGGLEIDPRASMLGANKQQQSTIRLNNRESTNTKEGSEMVNELEKPGKFMGWLLA